MGLTNDEGKGYNSSVIAETPAKKDGMESGTVKVKISQAMRGRSTAGILAQKAAGR